MDARLIKPEGVVVQLSLSLRELGEIVRGAGDSTDSRLGPLYSALESVHRRIVGAVE